MFNSLNSGPRVKFLRKALFPRDDDSFQKLVASTDVLISTPLKLAQIAEKYGLGDKLQYLVIDEADKMFEMGFLEQID